MDEVCDLPSTGIATDLLRGSGLVFGWATQPHSETCAVTFPVLSRLCASGLYLSAFICPWILTSLPIPASKMCAHSMMMTPQCSTVADIELRLLSLPFSRMPSIYPFKHKGLIDGIWPALGRVLVAPNIYIYMNYLKNVIIPNTPFIVMTVIDDNNI